MTHSERSARDSARLGTGSLVLLSQLVLACQAPVIYDRFGFLVQSLVTSAFILILPGTWGLPLMARLWRRFRGGSEGEMALPAIIVAYLWTSLVLLVGAAVGRYVLAVAGCVRTPFSAWSLWAVLALTIEASIVLCLLTRASPLLPKGPDGRTWLTTTAVTAGAFCLTGWGASRVVPPQQDQDMVLICPMWGLYHDLLPLGLESRMPYQFNKPLAFYFFTGASIILRGDADLARPFYDSSRTAVRALKTGNRFPKGLVSRLRDEDITRFFGAPRLTESVRILVPGFAGLLAAAIFLLLVDHGASMGAATIMTVGAVAVPEMFIRFSCADFTSISLLLMVLMLWLYLRDGDVPGRMSAPLFWASAFLALTNHKALLLIPACVVGDLARSWGAGSVGTNLARWGLTVWRRGCAAGALAGTIAFWAYGLVVDSQVFFADHVQRDFLWRLWGRIDPTYPSLAGVWLQWMHNTGFVAIPLGIVCLGALAVRRPRRFAAIALWFIVGATLASLTDWKQTKHLMLALPPLLLAPGLVWSSCGRRLRTALVLLVCCGLAASGYTIYRLWLDFSYLPPSKVW